MTRACMCPIPLLLLGLALGALSLRAQEPSDPTPEPVAPEPKPVLPSPAHPAPPQAPWDGERLAATIRMLDSERFAEREDARMALESLPLASLQHLRQAAEREDDQGVRQRLGETIKTIFMTRVLPELAEWRMGKGFLGIQWSMNGDPPGIQVVSVIEGTSAEAAGLKDGDLIVKIDSHDFKDGVTQEQAMEIWSAMAPGDPMRVHVLRGESTIPEEFRVTIGAMPAEYQSPEQEEARKEAIWSRFESGSLKLPQRLLGPGSAAPLPAQPIQSWGPPSEPDVP
ncbi:MAG: PDZ domain-containing protein [Planctomycetota bacterium]|nr:PDZ domain-containing protein [Planctomycetota bacterium]